MNEQQIHEKIEELDNLLVDFRAAQRLPNSTGYNQNLHNSILKLQSVISEMKKISDFGKDND